MANPNHPVPEIKFDALVPSEMAAKAESTGVKKATSNALQLFMLAILAGAFVGLGAIYSTTVLAGSSSLPYGVQRLLGGLVFCLGLVLVIVGGAELFRTLLPQVDRLYLTELDGAAEAQPEAHNVFFPDASAIAWREVYREHHPADDGHAFPFTWRILERIEG